MPGFSFTKQQSFDVPSLPGLCFKSPPYPGSSHHFLRAVSQSDQRCCVSGCSSQFCPLNKTSLSTFMLYNFFFPSPHETCNAMMQASPEEPFAGPSYPLPPLPSSHPHPTPSLSLLLYPLHGTFLLSIHKASFSSKKENSEDCLSSEEQGEVKKRETTQRSN